MILAIVLIIQFLAGCISFPTCPVSHLKNDNIHDKTFTYRYPNLYFPNQSFTENNSYNCPYVNRYPYYIAPELRCSMDYMCPIHPTNILTVLNKQNWIATTTTFDRIISFQESVKQQEQAMINVILVGGSMPAGHDINCGCICTHDQDVRCNSDLNDRCTDKPEPCSWESHFSGWLQKHYPNIRFHNYNFAEGGVDSGFIATSVSDWIHEHEIQLTKNDLFIIDASCNDAGLVSAISIKIGVEALLRRIQYIMAHTLNTPDFRPTILLLEQFPYASNHPLPGFGLFPDKFKDRDYAVIYENLARHYEVMLWSIRDVYWTYYNQNIDISDRYPINPIPRDENPMHAYSHIPWFGNLYMADLLAACFLQTIKYQEIKFKSISPSTRESSVIEGTYPPPELYSHSSISKSYCNESKPFFIHNVSTSTFHPHNLTQYESILNTGWREYIDHHDTSGYIINKNSDPQSRSLVFKFELKKPNDISALQWLQSSILKIVYLKSYEGMGKASVLICGQVALKLDGLHSDYRHYRVSVPHFAFYTQLPDLCNGDHINHAEVVVQYEDPDVNNQLLSDLRKSWKFKLMSVEVCST